MLAVAQASSRQSPVRRWSTERAHGQPSSCEMHFRTGATLPTAQNWAATIGNAGPARARSRLAEGIAAVAIEGCEGSKSKAGDVGDELGLGVKADPREDEAQQADGDDPCHDE